jgi:hypothetical protein
MGRPNIISADNEIIDALYKDRTLYIEFDGIQLYRTSPHELNKNAIVERMIKKFKQYLINVLMTYKMKDLINYYRKYKEHYTSQYNFNFTFVDYLLEIVCEVNNNRQHRMIKAVPNQVFDGLELNKQKINHYYFDLYKKGTIVIKKPEGEFSFKLFKFDPHHMLLEIMLVEIID